MLLGTHHVSPSLWQGPCSGVMRPQPPETGVSSPHFSLSEIVCCACDPTNHSVLSEDCARSLGPLPASLD